MRALVLVLLAAVASCDRSKGSSGGEQPAPSSSVISIGVALGNCPDVEACARECDAGSADRCRRLAVTYALGQGAPQDETRATALYEKACDMKDPSACVFAGQMHEYAHGVPEDLTLAERDYERACDMQWPSGCYNEAIMLESGRGVPVDRAKAGDLYQIACTAGAKQACEKARQMHQPPVPPWLDGGLP